MADFEHPNSEIYFLNVPFSSDYKNVIDFTSITAQTEAFLGLNGKKHFTLTNIIRPTDRTLFIKEDFGDYYKYNYIMFRNPLLSNKWFYAFITNAYYNAKGTTEISYLLDVWQTFQFDITYYRCMIERGIVPTNKDNYKDWLQPEPLNVKPYAFSDNLNTSTTHLSWQPRFILEALSYPAGINNVYNNTRTNRYEAVVNTGLFNSKYTYGGSDLTSQLPNNKTSCIFGLELDSTWWTTIAGISAKPWYYNYTKILEAYGDLVDHRTDILKIRIIPDWMYNEIKFVTPVVSQGGGSDPTVPRFIYDNDTISTNQSGYPASSATLDNSKLTAINYTPRNKKMLSSLARTFILYNRSLLINKQFLPEYIIDNEFHTFNISAEGKPIELTHLLFKTFDYQLKNERYFEMPFNLPFTAAYNSNVGIQKALKITNSAFDLAQGVAHIAESAYGLQGANLAVDFAQQRIMPKGATQPWQLYQAKDVAFQKSGREEHGLYMLNAIQDTFNAGVSLAQSFGAMTGGNSTQPDMLTYSSENLELHFEEVNPNLEDCKVIDTFLDMYGYAINEVDVISNWTNTRSKWNYIKTQCANLKVKGADDFENTLKAMFNNGVTIWHGFAAFGVYNNKDVTNGNTINT